jgi:hypothetical protein
MHTDNTYSPVSQDGHTSFLCNMTGQLAKVPDPLPTAIPWAAEHRDLSAQPARHRGWRAEVQRVVATAGSTWYVCHNSLSFA